MDNALHNLTTCVTLGEMKFLCKAWKQWCIEKVPKETSVESVKHYLEKFNTYAIERAYRQQSVGTYSLCDSEALVGLLHNTLCDIQTNAVTRFTQLVKSQLRPYRRTVNLKVINAKLDKVVDAVCSELVDSLDMYRGMLSFELES